MKLYRIAIIIVSSVLICFPSCTDIYDQAIYQKPAWLNGKLFTQLESQENLSQFAEMIKRTGYDSIIDKSGSFTLFAPNNDAVSAFMQENAFTSIDEIPLDLLTDIVQFHIIQDAWSQTQLQTLDRDGWMDPYDPDSEPQAYKRQTLLKNPNEKYWVESNQGDDVIVMDSTLSNSYKKVYTRSRKYVPIFFDEFFGVYNLQHADYSFYFDREYEAGNIFYAGAKVSEEEVFAENGFIYEIDKVVEPMLNAKELLEQERAGESYNEFLELVYQFPQFNINLQETNDQAEARAGLEFDTLYNLSFPGLPFDLHEELTGPSINNTEFTYYRHNGVFVPTDQAFNSFLNEVVLNSSGFPHWTRYENVPVEVKRIILQSHLTSQAIYPTDISNGFEDGFGNTVLLDESDIISKHFGSNCTFIGLNRTVVPRAFSSITGPVYLRPGYTTFLYAMEKSKVLPAITDRESEFCFFPLADQVMRMDSSLMLEWIDVDLNRYYFRAYDRQKSAMVTQAEGTLAKRIMNQVGLSLPNQSADKEFIETLAGGYIIWNNRDNTVQGSRSNTFGYNGDSVIFYNPLLLEEPADNGMTWSVESWFKNTTIDLYSILTANYNTFMDLLEQAEMFDPKLFEFPFLVEGESYTVFIPSDEAIANSQIDTLPADELAQVLKLHFINGERIFTDNKKLWRDYETRRKDESSTSFSTNYTTLNIRPGRDLIEILDNKGDVYVSIPEEEGKTNIMVAFDTDKRNSDPLDWIITSVIHEIDSVLIPEILNK